MQRNSQSIILRRIGYGEADWIVTFFSRDFGRMSGIAKSARASQKRFGGALEPGTLVNLRLAGSGGARLVRMDEAEVLWPVNGVLKSLERIAAMNRALALALAFLQEHDANPEKFDLLARRIRAISDHEPIPHEAVAFELDWLKRCGFGPQIRSCGVCGSNIRDAGRWSFDFDHGSMLCTDCGASRGLRTPLSDDARLGFLAVSGFESGGLAHHAEAARTVLGRYIDYVLGKPMAVR